MKKTLLSLSMGILALASSLSASALTIQLDWTSNAASPQAVLYKALTEYKAASMAHPNFTMNLPNLTVDRTSVSLRDPRGSVNCQSGTAGSLAVQRYRCTLELNSISTGWSENSQSLPSVLYNALEGYAGNASGAASLNIQRDTISFTAAATLPLQCRKAVDRNPDQTKYRCDILR